MLTFVGLGLYDERSVTVEGREVIRAADRVVAEWYTSRLVGATVADLEAAHGREIEVRDRDGVEGDPGDVLADAERGRVAFLTAGDPMISTTHVDLRLRAADRGIETRIVHGVTAETAACGLAGLQNYRFGKATTLPFPDAHGGGVPDSVRETVAANRERGLHTLVYLDIDVEDDERFLTADVAAALLAAEDGEPSTGDAPAEEGTTGGSLTGDALAVAIARAGSPDPVVAADRLSALADREFGPPLHLLVVPGDLHHVEAEALATFADAPAALLPEE